MLSDRQWADVVVVFLYSLKQKDSSKQKKNEEQIIIIKDEGCYKMVR